MRGGRCDKKVDYMNYDKADSTILGNEISYLSFSAVFLLKVVMFWAGQSLSHATGE